MPDPAITELLDGLRAQPEVAALLAESDTGPPPGPVFDVRFRLDGATLSFFSVVSTLGMPGDVTAEELRVEAFFPGDDATGETWRAGAAATMEAVERGERR